MGGEGFPSPPAPQPQSCEMDGTEQAEGAAARMLRRRRRRRTQLGALPGDVGIAQHLLARDDSEARGGDRSSTARVQSPAVPSTVPVRGADRYAEWAHLGGHAALPSQDCWPERPWLFRHCSMPGEPLHPPLPLNEPVPIESALFSGHALFRLPHHEGTSAYWATSTGGRLNSVVIQGQFKKRLPFSAVYTGVEFTHPLETAHLTGLRTGVSLLRKLAPLLIAKIQPEYDGPDDADGADSESVRAAKKANQSYFLSPMAPTAKRLHVCVPGSPQAPVLGPGLILEEYTQLLGGRFGRAAEPISHRKRRKYFNSRASLAKYSYEPGLLYTFDFFSSGPNFSDFELQIFGKSIDLSRALAGQPLLFMAKVMPHLMPWDTDDEDEHVAEEDEAEGDEDEDEYEAEHALGGGDAGRTASTPPGSPNSKLEGDHLHAGDAVGGTGADFIWNMEVWHERQLETKSLLSAGE